MNWPMIKQAPKYRDKIRLLREEGFVYVRRVRHGEMWVKDRKVIVVPRQTRSDDPRSTRNWMSAFRQIRQELG
jgi:hypothetical protein